MKHTRPSFLYINVSPIVPESGEILLLNNKVQKQLNSQFDKNQLINILTGNTDTFGTNKYASVYAGHQFGYYNPQLGDGRAIYLGEKNGFEVQLKGSGPTPFSRNGDGLCPLGPAIREYIVSKYMKNAGLSTTQALSVVKNGLIAYRDYPLPAASLIRVAKSHLRIGHFEYFFHKGKFKELEELFNYSQQKIYPELNNKNNRPIEFFRLVSKNLIKSVNHWMSIGFIHGVMNTDNMAISGEIIDYGPCAFMEEYNPEQVFSSIDKNGRYRFNNQQNILLWNLGCLALALSPLLGLSNIECEQLFDEEFEKLEKFQKEDWIIRLGKKFGLESCEVSHWDFLHSLLSPIQGKDFTNFFNHLEKNLNDLPKDLVQELKHQQKKNNNQNPTQIMLSANPKFVPRNHVLEEVINQAYNENYNPLDLLNKAIEDPFKENRYLKKPASENEKVLYTFCGT